MRTGLKTIWRLGKRLVNSDPYQGSEAVSYSQEGEDILLDRLFENQENGFYVDVGAHHPTRFSNTFKFYRRGWRGINIDAVPGMAEKFAKLRPRDLNLEIGIGSSSGEMDYFMFNEPALNTFDAKIADERNGLNSYRLVETRKVRISTLAEVLASHFELSKHIDFLTVDVEGLDLAVLQSNEWSRFKPSIVLAEDTGNTAMASALNCPIAVYMRSVGYEFFAKTLYTMFFRRCDC